MLNKYEAMEDQESCQVMRELDAYITDGALRQWHLCWDSDLAEPVRKNAKAATFRGETYTIVGGRAPHHSGSTGRVYTAEGREFFPSVFDMKWVNTQE